jgi:DNA modification methylase
MTTVLPIDIPRPINRLILGDNLEVMKTLQNESVDLIYLDPPFFSNRNYEVIWGDEGEVRSFKDRWSGGIEKYIDWLKERVELMYRILKNTGSIFLHCDWHADAYIRVWILDKFFGEQNMRNHIVWRRTNAKSNISQKLGIVTDSILFYSKSDLFKPNMLYGETSSAQLSRYKQEDEKGLYRCENLTTPGRARQFVWRGVHPSENRSWCFNEEKLEELYNQGLIVLQKNGQPRKDGLKKYLSDSEGSVLNNLWDDIDRVANTSKERIGYPTQKPEALMDRIIKMASNEDDVVLDPFMGGGTTIAVAEKLNRKWIGIDQSVAAVKVTELRLSKQINLFKQDLLGTFTTELHKYDYDTLRYKDAFEFESWIIQQHGGEPNIKQRNDLGLDGKKDNAPIQVKRSDNVGRNVVDNFKSAVERFDKRLFDTNVAEGKPVGTIIAFSFAKGAVEEVSRLKNHHNVIIKLLRVDEIVPIATKPTVKITMRELSRDGRGNCEIEFLAEGYSEAGIEFYAWDFEYNEEKGFVPFTIINKSGKQTHTFKAGEHVVAVKVVDNDGLESIETIKLKVNGVVEKM